MQSKALASAARFLALLVLGAGTSTFAQQLPPLHFTGLLNDYVPLSPTIGGSPWEIHGQWSMDIHPLEGTADFAADLTMSGFGRTSTGAVDPTQPLVNPHTHHIKVTNAKIVWNMTGCPAYQAPVPTMGFQFTKVVSLLTGNGLIAPFETNPPSSTLQVCVVGGNNQRYFQPDSNITLVFGGLAQTKHFGAQAIHGVVRIEPDDHRLIF
jgi:hypothetical protein